LGVGPHDFDRVVVEPVSDHHVTQVAPVEQLDVDLGIELAQTPDLSVLAGGQLRPYGG
jgi:hypothetical protein